MPGNDPNSFKTHVFIQTFCGFIADQCLNAVNAGKILESVFCKLPAYAAYCSAEAAVNAGAAQTKILKHC